VTDSRTDLDSVLREWGDWNRDDAGYGHLGYPGSANFTSMPGGGGGLNPIDDPPPRVERLMVILGKMKINRPQLFGAVKQEYCYRSSITKASRALGCKPHEYRLRRREAFAWLEGIWLVIEIN